MTSPFFEWSDVNFGEVADPDQQNALGREVERLSGLSLSLVPMLSASKAADGAAKNNDTTLAADPILKLTLEPNSAYWVWIHVRYISTAVADFKQQVQPPGGTAWTLPYWSGLAQVALAGGFVYFFTAAGEVGSLGGSGVDALMDTWGKCNTDATGGDLSYAWAQNTAQVSDTFVRVGSFMIAMKIPS